MFTSVNSRAASAYKRVAVETSVQGADPHTLVGLLYDALLQSIAQARGAMERQQTSMKGELIGKAIGIISGLREGLDLQQGGELAANLDSLYQYMVSRLLEANVKNDAAPLDEVAGLLRNVKTGWDAIGQ